VAEVRLDARNDAVRLDARNDAVRLDARAELERVRSDVHHRTLDVCGLPPRDVMLVKPGTLPKTSSGKLQRAKCRELYLEESLELV